MNARPMGGYINLVRACFEYLTTRRDVAAIGSLGYCMGGRLVGELAAEGADLAAGVIYYGAPPKFENIPKIRCPLSGHYAATDHAITDKIPAFAAAMAAAGKEFTYEIYDANHGFSLTPGMPGYDEAATRLSMGRIAEFLARHLKAAAVAHAAE
jgi:carboxymethylenebutenolidase